MSQEAPYLFMYLLCGLGITERYSGQVFEDGHLHGAVAPIQQRHQGARVHRPIHNLGPNTCRENEVGGGGGGVNYLCLAQHIQVSGREEPIKNRKRGRRRKVFTHPLKSVCRSSSYLPLVNITHTYTFTHAHTDTHGHTLRLIWIPPLAVTHTVTRQQVLSPHEVITSIILSQYRSCAVCVHAFIFTLIYVVFLFFCRDGSIGSANSCVMQVSLCLQLIYTIRIWQGFQGELKTWK